MFEFLLMSAAAGVWGYMDLLDDEIVLRFIRRLSVEPYFCTFLTPFGELSTAVELLLSCRCPDEDKDVLPRA